MATCIQEILARQLVLQMSNNKLSEDEFEAALDAMTVYSDKIPVLPLDAFRRDEIYRDHNGGRYNASASPKIEILN
jgi:hypothetical protein